MNELALTSDLRTDSNYHLKKMNSPGSQSEVDKNNFNLQQEIPSVQTSFTSPKYYEKALTSNVQSADDEISFNFKSDIPAHENTLTTSEPILTPDIQVDNEKSSINLKCDKPANQDILTSEQILTSDIQSNDEEVILNCNLETLVSQNTLMISEVAQTSTPEFQERGLIHDIQSDDETIRFDLQNMTSTIGLEDKVMAIIQSHDKQDTLESQKHNYSKPGL